MGRLRTVVFGLRARGRHSARILSVLVDEGRQLCAGASNGAELVGRPRGRAFAPQPTSFDYD